MASTSKSKSKSSKVLSVKKPTDPEVVGRDFHGFWRRQDKHRFEMHFKKRKVVVEPPMCVPFCGEDIFYIQKMHQYNGWFTALAISNEANIIMVREFMFP